MPSKRTRRGRNARFVITEAVVDAFNRGDYLAVHTLMGLTPWQDSPLWVVAAEPPEWIKDDTQRTRHAYAWELRLAIIEAGGNPDARMTDAD